MIWVQNIIETLIITAGVVSVGFGLFALIRTIEKPDLPHSKRVKMARDEAKVAEYRLTATKADAQTVLIEAKRDQILDLVAKGEEREANDLLRTLARGTDY